MKKKEVLEDIGGTPGSESVEGASMSLPELLYSQTSSLLLEMLLSSFIHERRIGGGKRRN